MIGRNRFAEFEIQVDPRKLWRVLLFNAMLFQFKHLKEKMAFSRQDSCDERHIPCANDLLEIF